MSVITVGDFDGVHLGHRTLFRHVVQCATENHTSSIALTFDRNTKEALRGNAGGYLTEVPERRELILSEGIDTVCVLSFDENFRAMTPEGFLTFLHDRYGCTDLFGGEDFRFGANGAGKLTDGKTLCGIRQHVVELKLDLVKISSSAIRTALRDGMIGQANTWLGYPYSVSGTVVEGKHLGRTIGFPTVNITPSLEKILPKNGVYLTETVLDGKVYPSMTNVGIRPTVEPGQQRNVETHLLNMEGDFYGRTITVRFLDYIRSERRFSDLGSLMRQLRDDRETAMELYRSLVVK